MTARGYADDVRWSDGPKERDRMTGRGGPNQHAVYLDVGEKRVSPTRSAGRGGHGAGVARTPPSRRSSHTRPDLAGEALDAPLLRPTVSMARARSCLGDPDRTLR